jgi:hypothetical protein
MASLIGMDEQMERTATGASLHEIDAYITEMRKRAEHCRVALEQHEQEARSYRTMLEATEAALGVFDRPVMAEPPSPSRY